MRRLGLCLALCFGYLAAYCPVFADPADQPDSSVRMSDFARQVVTVDKQAGQIIALKGLLTYEPFVKLANEGSKNIDACIQFLSEQGHTPQQRDIAILSMHKLAFQDDVVFLRKLAEAFDQGLVSPVELGSAVAPTWAFSTALIENYTDDGVRSVLREIAARKDIRPQTRSIIEGTLSGQAAADLRWSRWNSGSTKSPPR